MAIANPTVTKAGDSNGGDNCNFYGLNAALLVMGCSITMITGGTIETTVSIAMVCSATAKTATGTALTEMARQL